MSRHFACQSCLCACNQIHRCRLCFKWQLHDAICVLQRRAATWPAIPPSPRSHSRNWSPTRCACAVNGNFGNPSFPGPFLHGQVVFYLWAEFQNGSRSVCSDLLPLICYLLSVSSDLIPLICYLRHATSDMLPLICYFWSATSVSVHLICSSRSVTYSMVIYLWNVTSGIFNSDQLRLNLAYDL
jgi:hypothetical protein